LAAWRWRGRCVRGGWGVGSPCLASWLGWWQSMVMITTTDLEHRQRCVDLAAEALQTGDDPFGSILVGADGTVLHEDRNRVVSRDDACYHPEIELVRWAQQHLQPHERAAATVYTSGEHCPMCAAAHGWAGLGRIVYASSAEQLAGWQQAMRAVPGPVSMLPIQHIAP